MKYRQFTDDKIRISALGFGMMRLPLKNPEDNGSIDYEKSLNLCKKARELGINYFDTAYNYHNEKSEEFVGYMLEKLGRKGIYITTKMPVWKAKSHSDYRKLFEEQKKRLKTDYIDFYIAHSLSKKTFKSMNELDIYSFFDELIENREIGKIGFSFHDDLNVFKNIVDRYDWDFCQIQLNYMDRNYQAGLEGMRYAKKKGLDIIVMEPLKGGRLAKGPEKLKEILNGGKRNYSPAQWALAYVLNHEEVSFALSGMNEEQQLVENARVADEIVPNSLTENELERIAEAVDFFNRREKIGCTSCEYCMPCPSDVNIPGTFSKINNAFIYDEKERQKKAYAEQVENGHGAERCIECGQCEELCPQHLEIIDLLKKSRRYLTE